jgi:hypothetical protein
MWGPDGVAIDLNTLIDPASGWVLGGAQTITNDNWVSGYGSFDPDGKGPLQPYARLYLIHVPEPAFMAPLMLAALAITSRRRANR